jgi:fumarate hydratase subunit beta
MRTVSLTTPLREADVRSLKIGDMVYFTGTVYTARDLAHRRIVDLLKKGSRPPFELEGAVIFHAGPIVEKTDRGEKLVVVGPTTSGRMEPYEAVLIGHGVRAVVGKGGMGRRTGEALKRHGAVYLIAATGCAVVHAEAVKRIAGVLWRELGMMEAVWVLEVERWGPLTVAMDPSGGNLLEELQVRAAKRLPQDHSELGEI